MQQNYNICHLFSFEHFIWLAISNLSAKLQQGISPNTQAARISYSQTSLLSKVVYTKTKNRRVPNPKTVSMSLHANKLASIESMWLVPERFRPVFVPTPNPLVFLQNVNQTVMFPPYNWSLWWEIWQAAAVFPMASGSDEPSKFLYKLDLWALKKKTIRTIDPQNNPDMYINFTKQLKNQK